MYPHILVPIDGSPTSARGLQEATQLAKQLGSRIRLVHVVTKALWVSPSVAAVALDEAITQLHLEGETLLHDAAAAVRDAGVEVDERLVEAFGDRVGEHVVAEAEAWPAQLIVCGTHGRSGVRRMLMGSDAEHIVRHSRVPVLLVRAPAS
jgi:nucleotide-binding universal stress UspA family protein